MILRTAEHAVMASRAARNWTARVCVGPESEAEVRVVQVLGQLLNGHILSQNLRGEEVLQRVHTVPMARYLSPASRNARIPHDPVEQIARCKPTVLASGEKPHRHGSPPGSFQGSVTVTRANSFVCSLIAAKTRSISYLRARNLILCC